jgi:hypothetical protein
MPRSYSPEYLPLWLTALDEEIGLLVRTKAEDHDRLVTTLYEARQQAGDPELDRLMLIQPARGTIYLAHKSTELDE